MLTFHLPTHWESKKETPMWVCVCVFSFKLCLYDTVCVKKQCGHIFLFLKSRCLCKLSQERHPGYSVVRSLPPVKIKYETFIIQGGLIWCSLSDGLCNGEALDRSTFTALKGWRGDPKGNHYARKQWRCRRGGETLWRVLPSLLPARHEGWNHWFCFGAYQVCVWTVLNVWVVCGRSH